MMFFNHELLLADALNFSSQDTSQDLNLST
jgi:hypothetical protein